MGTNDPLITIETHLARALDSARQVAFDWLITSDTLYFSGALAESFRGVMLESGATWHSRDLIGLLHEDDRARYISAVQAMVRYDRLQPSGVVHDVAVRMHDPVHGWRWIEVHAQVVERNPEHRALRAVGTLTDVNERKQSEQKIARLRDMYEALSQTNKAIVRMDEPAGLFHDICRIAVQFGRFRMAWIGLVDSTTLGVNTVATAGDERYRLVDHPFTIDEALPEGRGTVGASIRSGQPSILNDAGAGPALHAGHEQLRTAGVRSLASFPFRCGGVCVGALTLYSSEPQIFDTDLSALLEEMVSDISFALDHHGREQARERTEAALAASEQIKGAILGGALDCIITMDQSGRIIDFNPAAESTFGHRAADVRGTILSEVIIPQRLRIYHDRGLEAYLEQGQSAIFGRRLEQQALHADGHEFPVELTVIPIITAGAPVFTAFLRDISERKRAEQLQALQSRVLGMVATGATLPDIFLTLTSFIETHAAPALCSATLLDQGATTLRSVADASLPAPYRALFARVAIGAAGRTCGVAAAWGEMVASPNIDVDPLWSEAQQLASEQGIRAVACWPITGRLRNVLGTLTMHYRQYGEPTLRDRHLLELTTNLARIAIESRESEERIRFLAHYDGLTSLPNRFLFKEFLEHALHASRRNQSSFAVFFLDLDRFKNINDTFGHDAGDLVLKEISRRITSVMRKNDVVARMGGDEFYLLIEDLPGSAYAAEVAQKLITQAARPFIVEGQECHLTASIGIVLCPQDGDDAQTLLKHSDIAMYRAKALGKNTYQFYAADNDTHSVERFGMESRLRKAIEQQEFVLHYQPKCDLHSGAITGLEALVRWQDPERGLLAPVHFIAMAEETGLIVPLGRQILAIAARDSATLQSHFAAPLRIAVNLSARQLDDPQFLDEMRELMATPREQPFPLDLEITESMVMGDPEQAVRTMTQLQAMGIGLAIDDFGTGYSSLAYLKRFPVHVLKIDRSFVNDIPEDANDTAITQAVIAMGHTLGMRIVAEGVENAAQMQALRSFGCDEMQGYYFCRPAALETIIRLLHDRATAVRQHA